jgi:hypothetical protein
MAHTDAPGGHVRIWWPRTGLPRVAKAVPTLAQQAEHIWDRFAAVMGRTPVSDGDYCGHNGGNGRYDIYLINGDDGGHIHGYGITGPYKGYSLTDAVPALTEFNVWADDPPTGWALAHEMFHAFQFAYKHAEPITAYDGFDEGAADWGANYVYPKADLEHSDDTMLRYPGSRTFPDNDYGYELWPFDLYLTEKFGTDLMPAMYQAFGHEDELTAMNSVLPGGFAKRLPDFAKYGWNQVPVKGGFRSWDRFAATPWRKYLQAVPTLDLKLNGRHRRTANLPFQLRPLGRDYYPLHVADHDIRDLTFHNTVHGIQGASVQAFVKLADGTWHTQDWTGKKTVDFCRDEGPDKDVTDLVVMYANARYQDGKALDKRPTLDISDNCNHYYRVTKVTGSFTETFSYADTGHVYSCTDAGTQTYTVQRDPARTEAVDPYDASWSPGRFGLLNVPRTITGSTDYQQTECQGGDVWLPSCSANLNETGEPFGSFGDLSDPPDRVTVQLPVLGHLGDFYSDEPCDSEFKYTGVVDPVDYLDAGTVSTATLAGSAKFTVTGTDHTEVDGHVFDRTLSVTLQPTDENGVPLE